MGDYFDNAVRHPEDIGVGHIRRTVAFNSNGVGAPPGVKIGTLEAGAIPLRVTVVILTAFNGTSPTLDIGTNASAGGLAPSSGVAPGTAGVKAPTTGALLGQPLAADTTFYALQGGSGQTAGTAIIVIEFVNKRELVGVPYPNNP